LNLRAALLPNRTLLPVFLAAMLAMHGCSRQSGDGVEQGKRSLVEADTPTAIIHFKTALQQDPTRLEARFLLGRSLLRMGDVNGAAIELEKALEGEYSRDEVVPSLASALLRQGRLGPLIDRFGSTTLTDDQAIASLKSTLAVAYWQREDRKQAEAMLERALAADPHHSAALLLKANIAAADGLADEALSLLTQMLTHNPKDLQALMLMATLQTIGKSDPAAAEQTLERALKVEPLFVAAHKGLVLLSLQGNDIPKARGRLERLAQLAPKHSATVYLSAMMAYANRDFKQARTLVEPLLKSAGSSPHVLVLAAMIEDQGGTLLQAEAHLGKAVNQAPTAAQPRLLLANLYLRKGQEARALATIEPLLQATPPVPLALALAADAYLRRGDRERAEALYAEASKLSPENSRSKVALASLRAVRGDGESGLRELELLSQAARPEDLYADLALFNTHMRTRNFDAALKSAEQLAAKQPKLATPWIMRAGVFELMEDGISAKAALEKAIQLEPQNLRAVLRLADYDAHAGQFGPAVKRLEVLTNEEGASIRARLALIEFHRRAGQSPKETAAELTELARKYRKEPEAQVALVQELLAQDQAAAALDVAQAALAVVPDDLYLQVALGTAQLRAHKGEEAVNTFRKVASGDPSNVQLQYKVAEALLTNGRQQEAVATLRRILEVRADFLPAQRALAAILVRTGDSAGALKIARNIQAKRPQIDFGYLLEGDVEAARKNWGAAQKAYRRALALAASGEVAAKLHSVLGASKESGAASQFAAQWRKEQPNDVHFLSHLSERAFAAQRYDEAEALLTEVLRLVPGRATAWASRSLARMKLERPGAVQDAVKATQLAPASATMQANLAQVLYASGEVADAIKAQQAAVQLAKAAGPYRLGLVKLWLKAGNKTSARKELEALSASTEIFEGKSEVEGLLKQL